MKKRLVSSAILLLFLSCSLSAQTAPAATELTKLLNDFLAGASRNDPSIHDSFWADDLIYTRSAGRRVNKADVMRDVRSAPPPKPNDPKTIYTAEDIQIQQYGDTAVVAFRLVSTTEIGGVKRVANNLNSGTFVKRNGKWQVVAWQSTRMPLAETESKNQVTKANADFHAAMLSANVDNLTATTDPKFVWTHGNTETDRQKLFADLRASKLKYGKIDPASVSVSVYGETAVARGELTSEAPTHYTLTMVNQLGVWRAISLHTSN